MQNGTSLEKKKKNGKKRQNGLLVKVVRNKEGDESWNRDSEMKRKNKTENSATAFKIRRCHQNAYKHLQKPRQFSSMSRPFELYFERNSV